MAPPKIELSSPNPDAQQATVDEAPKNAASILGQTSAAQANYIDTVTGLRREFNQLVQQATDPAANDPMKDRLLASIDPKLAQTAQEKRDAVADAMVENILARDRETRLAWVRTNGGNREEPEDIKTKRKTLLARRATFDTLLPSDLYALSATTGYDLVPVCMYHSGAKKDTTPSAASLVAGDTLVTNFGNNGRVNSTIGCADILPPEIERVRIAGTLGIRLSGNPTLDRAILARNGVQTERVSGVTRPGFYSIGADGRGTYLPVYHRTPVEIVARYDALTEDERRMHRDAAYARYRDIRMEDMLEAGEPLSDAEEDRAMAAEMKDLLEKRRRNREKFGDIARGANEKTFMARPAFAQTVRAVCRGFGDIPEQVLLRLIGRESGFNPYAKNGSSSAYGLGQQINSTWKLCSQTLVPNYASDLDTGVLVASGAIDSPDELRPPLFDRENPVHQIIATAAYLRHVRELRDCSWPDAVVYYHTGPGFSDSHVAAAVAANMPVSRLYPEFAQARTVGEYTAVMRRFYGLEDFADSVA